MTYLDFAALTPSGGTFHAIIYAAWWKNQRYAPLATRVTADRLQMAIRAIQSQSGREEL